MAEHSKFIQPFEEDKTVRVLWLFKIYCFASLRSKIVSQRCRTHRLKKIIVFSIKLKTLKLINKQNPT